MSTGINRRSFLKTAAVGLGAGVAVAKSSSVLGADGLPAKSKSVAGLKVAPLDVVRIGFIGVGERGYPHVGTYLRLEGCEVRAICDNYEPAAVRAAERVVKAGRPKPDLYTRGDWKTTEPLGIIS